MTEEIMNTEEQSEAVVPERPKSNVRRVIILLVVSTCWILYGWMPIVPVGAILCLAIARDKKRRDYLLIFAACLIGFLGTGLQVNVVKIKRTNVTTGKEVFEHKVQYGIRFGVTTIDYFLNRGKAVIYDDTFCQEDVDKANAFIARFVEKYNTNDPNFMLDSFVYQQGVTKEQVKSVFATLREKGGDIKSTKYLGYLSWVYPQQKYTDITVVHTVEFEKECKWNSVHFRLIFYPGGLNMTRIDFLGPEVKYRVIKGMKSRNTFKKKE